MRSQSYEIASWVAEQPIGTVITSKDIKEALPWTNFGAISGCLFRLSETADPPILNLIGREGRLLQYSVLKNTISHLNFNSAPPEGLKRDRSCVEQRRHRMFSDKATRKHKQRLKKTPHDAAPVGSQEAYLKGVMNSFHKYKLIQRLDSKELWAELQRREHERNRNT